MHDARDDALLEAIGDEVEALGPFMKGERHASAMEQRAQTMAVGEPGRAEWFLHAGDRWSLSGEPTRARACYERALEDGGPTWIDPRALLVSVLFQLGASAEAEDVLSTLRRDIARSGALGPVHEFVGEALELSGNLQESLRWYAAGLTYLERQDPGAVDLGCLNGRYRVRRELGLGLDGYDVLCEERRREAAATLDEPDELPAVDETTVAPAMSVLHWPAGELDRVLGRWPQARADYGADHAEHRAVVERHLRKLAGHGQPVSVGEGDLDDYLAFATRHEHEPAEPATRAAYAAHLGLSGRARPWPPGRNDRCWCGSGLKYKKCCGGLADL